MVLIFVIVLLLAYAVLAAVMSSWDAIAGIALFLACLIASARLVRAGFRGLIDRTNDTYWAGVRDGLCRHCGYDKRVDPAGRCPECGLE
jgi:hypothetical protein